MFCLSKGLSAPIGSMIAGRREFIDRALAVRSVRRALESKSFTGDSGKFRVRLDSGEGMNREVIMSLNGKGKRVYLHSGMTADEVWIVLNQVIKHGA